MSLCPKIDQDHLQDLSSPTIIYIFCLYLVRYWIALKKTVGFIATVVHVKDEQTSN